MRFIFCVLLISCLFISCTETTAEIWTNRPEFAFYVEYFNTSQNQYKISVKYHEMPAMELDRINRRNASSSLPDLVIGSRLKNENIKENFKTLDNLFGAKRLSADTFYPGLLSYGRIDNKQYLLPVSFNVPALIFPRRLNNELSNQFTIGFDEIKELSGNFNVITRGAHTRMGFSPLWNDNFLITAAILFETSFTGSTRLEWDAEALERSMEFIYDWTNTINTSNQAEEEFTYKYFIEPPTRLIQTGRILFSYTESSELFTLSEDKKNNLDFRWIMENEKIPLIDDTLYIGIPSRAKSAKAARAFILWFFEPETQRQLLEYSKSYRINETVFGIAGGFSALLSVTEEIFPQFYGELLGRMPPSVYFSAPDILPGNWFSIKERVILPYLHDRARASNAHGIIPLERRLSDWQRVN